MGAGEMTSKRNPEAHKDEVPDGQQPKQLDKPMLQPGKPEPGRTAIVPASKF